MAFFTTLFPFSKIQYSYTKFIVHSSASVLEYFEYPSNFFWLLGIRSRAVKKEKE